MSQRCRNEIKSQSPEQIIVIGLNQMAHHPPAEAAARGPFHFQITPARDQGRAAPRHHRANRFLGLPCRHATCEGSVCALANQNGRQRASSRPGGNSGVRGTTSGPVGREAACPAMRATHARRSGEFRDGKNFGSGTLQTGTAFYGFLSFWMGGRDAIIPRIHHGAGRPRSEAR